MFVETITIQEGWVLQVKISLSFTVTDRKITKMKLLSKQDSYSRPRRKNPPTPYIPNLHNDTIYSNPLIHPSAAYKGGDGNTYKANEMLYLGYSASSNYTMDRKKKYLGDYLFDEATYYFPGSKSVPK